MVIVKLKNSQNPERTLTFCTLKISVSALILTLQLVSCEVLQRQPLQIPPHQRPPYPGSNSGNPTVPYQATIQSDRDNIIETKCRFIQGSLNKLYERTVSRDQPLVINFEVDRRYFVDAANTNLRIEMEVDDRTTLNEPVLFAVAQRKYISTFELPQVFESGNGTATRHTPVYYTAGKTLCIQKKDPKPETQNVTIRVTTSSTNFISFRLKLDISTNFQIPLDKEIAFTISPTRPVYLGFQSSRPDLAVLKIKALSDSGSCMTMSVQPPYCPIYDKQTNVKHQGLWQTMTTQSAMTVELVNRFQDGFVIVLVAHDSDEKCSKSGYINPYDPPPMRNPGGGVISGISNNTSPLFGSMFGSRNSPRNKNVTLLITNESKQSGWTIFLVLGIPAFSTLFLILVVVCLFRNRHNWLRVEAEQNLAATDSGLITSMRASRPTRLKMPTPTDDLVLHDLGVLPSPPEEDSELGELRSLANGERILSPTRTRPPSDYLKAPIERFYNKRTTSTGGGGGIRWKADLTIGDFPQKDAIAMKKSGRRFYFTIIIVAVFYCIPVYQLIIHYVRVLYRTGEYDLCYYNYLCAHRLGVLVDFNHFWSNISYMIFGIAFNILVGRRAHSMSLVESTRKRRSRRNRAGATGYITEYEDQTHPGFLKRCFGYAKIPTREDHGIPQNFGIFYALGMALMLEGILSAAYHLCPNQSSFQFDTCFMYIIAVLMLLKIYQFRHSVHFGANRTFLILAAFVLISVFGLMFEYGGDRPKQAYRWTFIGFQFVVMSLLSIYFYSFGYIRKRGDQDFVTDIRILGNLGQLKGHPINGDRLILPLISFLLGVAVLIYCTLGNIDFATYLLYVLVSNVIGSTFYYVGIMKPLHGEFKNKTWVQPCIYFLGAAIIGGFAVTYFVRSPAAWELSAAASRAGNEDCLKGYFPFYPYYDSHDVWHFYSAAALFLSFMALLIVDDDLMTTPQNQIPVF